MEKIRKLSIPREDVKVIVISDIHGEPELLKRLLKKVDFGVEDYLIINGDLCEKGRNSSEVVRYVMDLCANNAKVHVTEGNCDTLAEEVANENPEIIPYLCQRRHSILNEWLAQLGYQMDEKRNIHEIKTILSGAFDNEMNWLMGLPTAIETEDYIFVHAGIDDGENWRDTDRDTAICIDTFHNRTHRANQYVVVGHYPVSNYPSDVPTNNPLIDPSKRIISIDGGNVIKATGQLNALIIHRSRSGDTFSHTYVDHFPECRATNDFQADPKMVGAITYPDFDVQPMAKENDFTLCQQAETNRLVYVKNEYLVQAESERYTVKTDVPCAQLSVKKGDVISVIDDTCTGYALIKQDGRVGWVATASLSGDELIKADAK